MPTRTIPTDQWSEFLDSFTREQRTRAVTIRVSDRELGYQEEIKRVPLLGVSADMEAGGGPKIEVMVGTTELDHTTHSVINPTAVRLLEDEGGEPEILELEAYDGSKTIVVLKPTAYGEPGALVERD
ncbi:MAG: DUF5335 domain-containing protein [Actinobacteria bacterium]|nr:DUF5335 domain-containing protein [Actinomycetota bacterium]